MARGCAFEAWNVTRKDVVFTTHTPIPEGNEQHPIDRFIYMGANLNMNKRQLKAIGGDPFNMTVGALRLSRVSNAVSDLHRVTARKMWKKVKGGSKIIGITNGIHIPTWVDRKMLELAEEYNGTETAEEELWGRHMHNKDALIGFIEKRTGVAFDRNVLLIGFARRAAPYKRSGLLLSDLEFLEPLLRERKLQIVFSGKSHPLDDTGKGIIAEIVAMTRKYPGSIVFLENYDMEIGRVLTRGADVWLNPRRPREASGTSGEGCHEWSAQVSILMDGGPSLHPRRQWLAVRRRLRERQYQADRHPKALGLPCQRN